MRKYLFAPWFIFIILVYQLNFSVVSHKVKTIIAKKIKRVSIKKYEIQSLGVKEKNNKIDSPNV